MIFHVTPPMEFTSDLVIARETPSHVEKPQIRPKTRASIIQTLQDVLHPWTRQVEVILAFSYHRSAAYQDASPSAPRVSHP